jgi:hypothetical protein
MAKYWICPPIQHRKHTQSHTLPYKKIKTQLPSSPIPNEEWTTNNTPCKETLSIRILCIHHQTTEINIANLETKLLQITTNLKVNPPSIKAPPSIPLNVKVHKHPKWNKKPYLINRSQNTSPQLPNFPQNQHQKFPPQYCYYTCGSFTPPKKLSKNIWEPARAGYGI